MLLRVKVARVVKNLAYPLLFIKVLETPRDADRMLNCTGGHLSDSQYPVVWYNTCANTNITVPTIFQPVSRHTLLSAELQLQ